MESVAPVMETAPVVKMGGTPTVALTFFFFAENKRFTLSAHAMVEVPSSFNRKWFPE